MNWPSTDNVGRHRDVNLLWMRQVQVVHNVLEALQGLIGRKSTIALLLLTNGRVEVAVIVVTRVQYAIIGQRVHLLHDGIVHLFGATALEVRSTAVANVQ